MADGSMEFARSYFRDGNMDMDSFIPKLPVKYRDQLCFKGRKIDYEDFAKFVKRDGVYTPLVCLVGEPTGADQVLDFSSLLAVGLAEVVTMISHGTNLANCEFANWVNELEFSEDWYDMLDRGSAIFRYDISDPSASYLALAETLRSSLIDYRFPIIKRIYADLMALRWHCPKSFCAAVIEGIKLAFSVSSVFMTPHLSFESMAASSGSAEAIMYEQVLQTSLCRWGCVEYTPDGSDKPRRISDGRGLGLSALCLFLIDIFNRFGDSRLQSPVPFRDPSSREAVEAMFEGCLGDDFVGRTIRNGRCFIPEVRPTMKAIGVEAEFVAVDCGELSGVVGRGQVGRGFREAAIMFEHAIGAKCLETPGVLPPVSCTYGVRADFFNACMNFVNSNRGMNMSKDILNKEQAAIIDQVMERADLRALVQSYSEEATKKAAGEITKLSIKLELAEDALAKVAAERTTLESALSEKQNIINELRSELSSMRSKVRGAFAYESEIDDSEETVTQPLVSTEEMLRFVNQFRLIIVGGYDILQKRLEDFGFTNFYFITSERASNSTMVSGDFFCLCTKFLSHKLAYNVEANYSKQVDRFFYFNGTNVEMLLRTYYEFMKDYFEVGDATET